MKCPACGAFRLLGTNHPFYCPRSVSIAAFAAANRADYDQAMSEIESDESDNDDDEE